jgi:prepilin-type N-terminal cleavage/methylation domain-containing protein/prepilin-type processing-associated H-X9-DG protein
MQPPIRRAFTLIEILVVLAIIAVLMAFLLPALEKSREKANQVRCGSNLSQIGLAISMYANENHGNYPRTRYDPAAPLCADTNASALDPFQSTGPLMNDTTAPMFLLLRTNKLPPAVYADPYNDVVEYEAEPADPMTHSNFTDFRKNCAYSYANAYPDAVALANGYKLTSKIRPAFAVAADLNPGTGVGQNSRNHEGRGQNVLFGDGHVEWEQVSACGISGDDIFTNRAGVVKASPLDANDSVLLPASQ